LAATARWTAGARAVETAREDALFKDPWAAALAGEDGRQWAESRPVDSLLPMVLRTRFFDDFLLRATRAEGRTQVVLLAAGLDSRALRLPWPSGTVVFELDRPDVLHLKQELLDGVGARPTCERRVCLATDLSQNGWPRQLVSAGFDPSAPTAWLAEGFLFYVPSDKIRALFSQISDLAPIGSALGFDVIDSTVLTHPLTRAWVQMQADAGAPWTGSLDDPVGYLATLGWRTTLSQCGATDADYGRWPYPVIPITAPDLPHHWLATATKA
jgi:methyltransferase (TIGR00027 family)